MRLEPRAFGAAAGLVAAILFLICALAVFLAPDATTTLGKYLIHMNLSGMPRMLTAGSFIVGLIVWPLGTAAVFAGVAAVYNALLPGLRVGVARNATQSA